MKKILSVLCVVCTLIITFSCQKKEPEVIETFTLTSAKQINLSGYGQTDLIKFKSNVAWRIDFSEGASSWLSVNKTSDKYVSYLRFFEVTLTAEPNDTGVPRKAEITIEYGSQGSYQIISVEQGVKEGMKPCTVTSITDDIIFSTSPSGTSTSVQQGFDFNEDASMMYFSQVTSYYYNTISWTPREQITTSTTLAPNKMKLYFFSHGNNIHYEKGSDGGDYIWIGNYGSRDSDGKYVNPQILSRVKLANGTVVRNTETKDNYYFGTKTIHASFDVKNDRLAIFSYPDDGYIVKIYSLSAVLNTPVTNVTLPVAITYGGGSSGDAEVKNVKPVVSCHDCSSLKPLYSFAYKYSSEGRGWQTFCISENRVYFFLFLSNSSTEMAYQSVLDVFDLSGNVIKKGILQPFADNMNDLKRYGFTDDYYKYMENEGIIVRNGVMYLMYTAKVQQNPTDKVGFRRPVVFQFDAAAL